MPTTGAGAGAGSSPGSGKIHCTEDARRLARRRMPRMLFDFVDGAAGRERAARRNRAAFDEVLLQPRVLVNIEAGSLGSTILGEEMGLPFGIAPMGMCNLTWPGADAMLAATAARHRIPLCVSTASSTRLEALYEKSDGQAWFQLYAGDSAEAARKLVKRAQGTGYTRLILTVDVPRVARRVRDLKNGFQVPFRLGTRQFVDFALHPRWSLGTLRRGIPCMMNFTATDSFARHAGRGTADWAFLDQLRAQWRGKLIVKGVLSARDARRVKEAGADAVYVSNHGGRQLDSAPSALAMLPGIRAAVGADYPLIFDSGVRGGEDLVKALALGADFVMLGRPLLFAIGADGARGLADLMAVFAEEISTVLAQVGLRRPSELDAAVTVTMAAARKK